MSDDAPRRGSPLLLALAVVLTVGGLTASALGLQHLLDSLDVFGYGSMEVRYALGGMGLAGGALGMGISLLIWEMAARLGARR